MKLIKEYFYTIDDFYDQNQGGNWKTVLGIDDSFTAIQNRYLLACDGLAYHGYTSTYSSIIQAIWNMLRLRHKLDYCYMVHYLPMETEQPLTESQCKELLSRFTDVFNLTMPRYLPLLKAYQDNDATPLKQMESSSTGKTRFNDTPQSDDLTDGYYATDSHATNVTAAISETSTDPAALYEQLDKLYQNWRSIIRDWINEFDGLFINGVNII